ncbi:hypothetical protein RJT34_33135 [Clitoria ternatea]|uniref:Uncharacterized protein n=1 Tax=Clitoria ternatea TaxID=43366 RepID=A0AAN9F1G8_CLITE
MASCALVWNGDISEWKLVSCPFVCGDFGFHQEFDKSNFMHQYDDCDDDRNLGVHGRVDHSFVPLHVHRNNVFIYALDSSSRQEIGVRVKVCQRCDAGEIDETLLHHVIGLSKKGVWQPN